MIKITSEMLENAKTRRGGYTREQTKIMTNIFGKGWIKKVVDCEGFPKELWEKFKKSNVSKQDRNRGLKKKTKNNTKVLDTGKFDAISQKKEDSSDNKFILKQMDILKELRNDAGSYCVDIYKDFSEEEVKQLSQAIQAAWKTGKKIDLELNKLLSKER
jgi:hypothetical protein